MWVINKDGQKTFIDSKNLKMFLNKGWKAYYPEAKKEQKKPAPTKRKRNNKK